MLPGAALRQNGTLVYGIGVTLDTIPEVLVCNLAAEHYISGLKNIGVIAYSRRLFAALLVIGRALPEIISEVEEGRSELRGWIDSLSSDDVHELDLDLSVPLCSQGSRLIQRSLEDYAGDVRTRQLESDRALDLKTEIEGTLYISERMASANAS